MLAQNQKVRTRKDRQSRAAAARTLLFDEEKQFLIADFS